MEKAVKESSSKNLDLVVHQIAAKETAKVDCTTCGNCCKTLQPPFSKEDIDVVNKVAQPNWDKTHLKFDVKNQVHYLSKSPCLFLCNLKCSIYKNRPVACATYPGLHLPHFKYRFNYFKDNYHICPIVFNTIEKLKNKFGIC